MEERWYVGAKNDGLFIIDKPPRPSNDDVVDIPGVNVIATVSGSDRAASSRAKLLAASKQMYRLLTEFMEFSVDGGATPEWTVRTADVLREIDSE